MLGIFLMLCVRYMYICLCACMRLSANLSSLAITLYFMVHSPVVDGFIGGLIGSVDSGVSECVSVYFKVIEFHCISNCHCCH